MAESARNVSNVVINNIEILRASLISGNLQGVKVYKESGGDMSVLSNSIDGYEVTDAMIIEFIRRSPRRALEVLTYLVNDKHIGINKLYQVRTYKSKAYDAWRKNIDKMSENHSLIQGIKSKEYSVCRSKIRASLTADKDEYREAKRKLTSERKKKNEVLLSQKKFDEVQSTWPDDVEKTLSLRGVNEPTARISDEIERQCVNPLKDYNLGDLRKSFDSIKFAKNTLLNIALYSKNLSIYEHLLSLGADSEVKGFYVGDSGEVHYLE